MSLHFTVTVSRHKLRQSAVIVTSLVAVMLVGAHLRRRILERDGAAATEIEEHRITACQFGLIISRRRRSQRHRHVFASGLQFRFGSV